MSFIARHIAAPPECPVPITSTVLRRAELDALGDAIDYARAVRREADALMARAHEQATALDEQTALERAERSARADAALLERALELEAAYEACRDGWVARLETTLDAAFDAAIKRLGATLPPAQRIRVCAQALRDCVSSASGGCLFVSPEDAAALGGVPDVALPWPIQADASLAPGNCRLEVGGSGWEIKWESIIERFLIAVD